MTIILRIFFIADDTDLLVPKLDSGLQRLRTADKAAVDRLLSYGTQKRTTHYLTCYS